MIFVIATTLGGGDGNGGGSGRSDGGAGKVEGEHDSRPVPKTYEVQSGDTLSSIASETGVPVERIVRLNPGVDPQILIAGEKLKLR